MSRTSEPSLRDRLLAVQASYEDAIDSMHGAAPGTIRATKGALVEWLAEALIEISWSALGKPRASLSFGSGKHPVPLNRQYLERLPKEVRIVVEAEIDRYRYGLGCDGQVMIGGEFKLGIECKAYSENAMLKRILVDFTMLRQLYPDLKCVLFQLESMLGGDYSSDGIFGSPATHTIMSHFDVDLEIITLLEGERNIDKPIHHPDFRKPLSIDALDRAVGVLTTSLFHLA